jgi:hypothetical protein
VTNCELSESECYRFIPLTSFTWEGTGLPAVPEKLDKFTAFYKIDYGDNAGLVSVRDPNLNIAAGIQFGHSQDFVSKETTIRAVTNGLEGDTDNFHNAHLGQLVILPGCRSTAGDCLHVHWRRGDMLQQ